MAWSPCRPSNRGVHHHPACPGNPFPAISVFIFGCFFPSTCGIFFIEKVNILYIESVPFQLRKIADHDSFKKSYGELLKKYPKVTFDKDSAFKNPDAEFVSFGHPLFESVMVWIENHVSDALLNGATFIDPDGKIGGHILFYEGEIRDGTGAVAGKRLFGFYVSETEIRPVSPAIIWDLAEGQNDKNEKGFNHEEHEGHEV